MQGTRTATNDNGQDAAEDAGHESHRGRCQLRRTLAATEDAVS